jgi:hypothetical protein
VNDVLYPHVVAYDLTDPVKKGWQKLVERSKKGAQKVEKRSAKGWHRNHAPDWGIVQSINKTSTNHQQNINKTSTKHQQNINKTSTKIIAHQLCETSTKIIIISQLNSI